MKGIPENVWLSVADLPQVLIGYVGSVVLQGTTRDGCRDAIYRRIRVAEEARDDEVDGEGFGQ